MYRTIANIAKRFFTDAQIYKYGFNWSPMYKRSTGKIIEVSDDLHYVKIKIPLSWKNRNYVGSMFGGSMLSATDPIYMIQLINILGDAMWFGIRPPLLNIADLQLLLCIVNLYLLLKKFAK